MKKLSLVSILNEINWNVVEHSDDGISGAFMVLLKKIRFIEPKLDLLYSIIEPIQDHLQFLDDEIKARKEIFLLLFENEGGIRLEEEADRLQIELQKIVYSGIVDEYSKKAYDNLYDKISKINEKVNIIKNQSMEKAKSISINYRIISEYLNDILSMSQKEYPFGYGIKGIIHHYLYESKDPDFELAEHMVQILANAINLLVPNESEFQELLSQLGELMEDDFS